MPSGAVGARARSPRPVSPRSPRSPRSPKVSRSNTPRRHSCFAGNAAVPDLRSTPSVGGISASASFEVQRSGDHMMSLDSLASGRTHAKRASINEDVARSDFRSLVCAPVPAFKPPAFAKRQSRRELLLNTPGLATVPATDSGDGPQGGVSSGRSAGGGGGSETGGHVPRWPSASRVLSMGTSSRLATSSEPAEVDTGPLEELRAVGSSQNMMDHVSLDSSTVVIEALPGHSDSDYQTSSDEEYPTTCV